MALRLSGLQHDTNAGWRSAYPAYSAFPECRPGKRSATGQFQAIPGNMVTSTASSTG
ncbi:hypothetical protein HMPREF0208_03337 [Citrobacter koseri]|nr:hypothetical protein HMPREF3220_00408 [Citrobacter koseri]KXB41807.1 hypothetical protein HMPREF0208_03337 [Citrobacter koseri]